MLAEHSLDVSLLEPCEPLERILAALPQLPAGHYLHVLHRMEPHPLYPILKQLGYAWITQVGQQVELFIWQRDDIQAEQSVKALLKL